MVTLTKYGDKYNRMVLRLEGLSTETKPVVTYIEYDDNGIEVGRMAIQNGSMFTEIDTGKIFMYDVDNTQWHEVSAGGGGGGGGGGFTPTQAQLDAMNSGINSTKVAQIATNSEVIVGIDSTGNNYIEMKNGQRLYISPTEPTGTIPEGSIGIGF